ncbi:MAG TPA: quinoprotein relay system zinc metallohydrolase 2 [Steroidobacteraceae bacterium]|jgi:quinoprotein relay system zinc metallohydrolase 2
MANQSKLRATTITRRDALLGALCGCCVPAFAATRAAPLKLDEVAPGLFIRRGLDEDLSAQNENAIANIGFVVGRRSVAVFDPGGSRADGERLRAAIVATTRLPIRYVVLSHVHPDHFFGASAFERDRPQFVGHARLPRALAQRAEYYRKRLVAVLGEERAGTVVMPTQLVQGTQEIDLGGRVLQLTAHELGHSDSDLTVLDAATATLLCSDLLFVRRVPALDGSLRGWIEQLDGLKRLPARRAVPGHGPTGVDWPQGSADLDRYLGILLRETREAIGKGLPIEDAVNLVGQSERPRWALFDEYHGGNVTQAFKELEWE